MQSVLPPRPVSSTPSRPMSLVVPLQLWFVVPFRRAAQGTLKGLGAAFKVWRPRVPNKQLHSFLQVCYGGEDGVRAKLQKGSPSSLQ